MNKKAITILSLIVLLILIGTLAFGWRAGWFSKNNTVSREQRLAELKKDPSNLVLSDKYKFDQIVDIYSKYQQGQDLSSSKEAQELFREARELKRQSSRQFMLRGDVSDILYKTYDSNGKSISLGILERQLKEKNNPAVSDFSLTNAKAAVPTLSSLYDPTKELDKTTNFITNINTDPFDYYFNASTVTFVIYDTLTVQQLSDILSVFAPGDVRFVVIDGDIRIFGVPDSTGSFSYLNELNYMIPTGKINGPVHFEVAAADQDGLSLKVPVNTMVDKVVNQIKKVTSFGDDKVAVYTKADLELDLMAYGNDTTQTQQLVETLIDSVITKLGDPKYALYFDGIEVTFASQDGQTAKKETLTDYKSLQDSWARNKTVAAGSFQVKSFSSKSVLKNQNNIMIFDAVSDIKKMVEEFNSNNRSNGNSDLLGKMYISGKETNYNNVPDEYYYRTKSIPDYLKISPYIPRDIVNKLEDFGLSELSRIFGQIRNKNVRLYYSNQDPMNACYDNSDNSIMISEYFINEIQVYFHEIVHSVYGNFSELIMPAMNEGTTTTVAEYVENLGSGKQIFDDRVIAAYRNLEQTNIPQLNFSYHLAYSDPSYRPSRIYYQLGAALMSKLYLEDPNFFNNFYQNLLKKLSSMSKSERESLMVDVFLRQKIAYKVIQKIISKVEGLQTGKWLENQHYLQSVSDQNTNDSLYLVGARSAQNDLKIGNDNIRTYLYISNLSLNKETAWEFKFSDFKKNFNNYAIEIYGMQNNQEVSFGQKSGKIVSNTKNIEDNSLILTKNDFSNIPNNYNGLLHFKIVVKNDLGTKVSMDQYFYSSDTSSGVVAILPSVPDGTLVNLKGETLDNCSQEGICVKEGIVSEKIDQSAFVKNGLVAFPGAPLYDPARLTIGFSKNLGILAGQSGSFGINQKTISKTFNKINGEYSTIVYPDKTSCPLEIVQKKSNLITFSQKLTRCSSSSENSPAILFLEPDGFVKEKCSLGLLCQYTGNDASTLKVSQYFYPKDLQFIK